MAHIPGACDHFTEEWVLDRKNGWGWIAHPMRAPGIALVRATRPRPPRVTPPEPPSFAAQIALHASTLDGSDAIASQTTIQSCRAKRSANMPPTGSSLIAVGPVLRQSCMRTGPSPPGGKADRGSRLRRRAAQTPAGTPGAVDVPGLHPGQAPNPGTSSRWRTNMAAANRQARDPQRTLKLLQTASATLPPPRGAPGR